MPYLSYQLHLRQASRAMDVANRELLRAYEQLDAADHVERPPGAMMSSLYRELEGMQTRLKGLSDQVETMRVAAGPR